MKQPVTFKRCLGTAQLEFAFTTSYRPSSRPLPPAGVLVNEDRDCTIAVFLFALYYTRLTFQRHDRTATGPSKNVPKLGASRSNGNKDERGFTRGSA
jgi:hypothetical protein